ncbi:MAG: right-handed parallel beta-helix repeat-containing protein [Tepidisphaeraceae bacterium]
MANLYVATTGSDSAAGSLAAPYATIARAASAAKPGDNVYVRGGTYMPGGTNQIFIGSKGTASAHITFQPYNNEKVVLDGTNLAGKDLVSIMGSYVDFGGFEVRNSQAIGIVLVNASYIRIFNNVVHDNSKLGIAAWGASQSAWTNVLVEGNTVYNNVKGYIPTGDNATGGFTGTGFTYGQNLVFRNNTVYHNYGEGITTDGVGGSVVIEDNTMYDNRSMNIYLMQTSNAVIQRNLLYSLNDTRFYRYGMPAVGIQIANESTHAARASNNTVVNNITYNLRSGFYFGNYALGGALVNTLVANNTFVNSVQAGLWIDSANAGQVHSGSRVMNNVFTQQTNTNTPAMFTASSGITFTSNLWHTLGAVPASVKSSSDVYADPKFVVTPSGSTLNFRVQILSPAVDKGTNVSAITTDFDQNARVQNGRTDIGAYEATPIVAAGGDFNGDGKVNFSDILVLAANYGKTTATFADGDANRDGRVDFADLLVLASKYTG